MYYAINPKRHNQNPAVSAARLPKGRCLLIALTLSCLAFAGTARAQTQCLTPPQDGFYPGNNTAEGDSALCGSNSGAGFDNTAIGYFALFNNSGNDNTANGSLALTSNVAGYDNTATGYHALLGNSGGARNTATGSGALTASDGLSNTATGFESLTQNRTGNFNTANGDSALF